MSPAGTETDSKTDILEELIAVASEGLPVVKRTIAEYGEHSLGIYLKDIKGNIEKDSLQPREDLIKAVIEYLTPLLGWEVAERTARDIEQFPVLLTSNHHCVEHCAQAIQGNVLFFLYRVLNDPNSSTMPIFSGGGVSMCNISYPRGMLLYNTESDHTNDIPLKIPIFPRKYYNCMVSTAPPFTKQMVIECINSLNKKIDTQTVAPHVLENIKKILNQYYLEESVLNQTSYAKQATILNHSLGKCMFQNLQNAPDVAYIEIEAIATKLIKKDFEDVSSLAYAIFFHDELRRTVISNLNGNSVCWNQEKLEGLINKVNSKEEHNRLKAGCGTDFLWALDDQGRRYPLMIEDETGKELQLVGINSAGQRKYFSFKPEKIIYYLSTGEFFPNVFTAFLVIQFARKYTCIGGYFQGDYLMKIQAGLMKSFSNIPRYKVFEDSIRTMPSDRYLCGPMFAMVKNVDFAVPAGTIEIVSKGGFTQSQINDFLTTKVEEAHHLGLFDLYVDIVSRKDRISNWEHSVATKILEQYSKNIME